MVKGHGGTERRCVIVGAGDFFGFPFPLKEDDLIMAADAGYERLKERGIRPSLIVGDFDSMEVEGVDGHTGDVAGLSIFSDAEKAEYLHHLREITVEGIAARAICPVKNDPDMLACVRIGIQEGCREFHLLGGTGGRIDHSLANVQILHFLSAQGLRGYLYAEKQVLTALSNGHMSFPPESRGYFSALSLTDASVGVTERGFKYIIEDVTLHSHTPTGLSNEFVGTAAHISVREGTLLLIYSLVHAGLEMDIIKLSPA